MNHLDRIQIQNFRGFDNLSIDGFSKINLFIGKNNVGKSSILESIFILLGMSNPTLPRKVNQFRGIFGNDTKQLKYIFHNLDTDNKPILSGHIDDNNEYRKVEIKAKLFTDDKGIGISSVTIPEIIGLDLDFSTSQNDWVDFKTFRSSVEYEGSSAKVKIDSFKENQLAIYINSDKNDSSTIERYSEIIKRKSGDDILEALKNFDSNINDIKVLPDGIYFDLKNVEELVPMNVMGDGIRRFLNIASTTAISKGITVCIDEIENGLHYSAYKLLWKYLLIYSEENNIQLFITTHNIETIACLKNILEEKKYMTMQDDVKIFSISKTAKSGYKAYPYTFAGFSDAIDYETEIRD